MKIYALTIYTGLILVPATGAPLIAEHTPGVFDAPWLGFDLGEYEQAGYPHGGTVNDFDGDGDLDVAVPTTTSFPEVSVLLNSGDGTLGQPTHYALAKASHYIVSADFDGDKDIDLVVSNMGVNWEGNTISLYRNNGDGTFQGQQQFSVGAGQFVGPAGIAFADFNLDGDLDLAVTKYGFLGQGTTVALLNNDGDGTFAAPLSFPAGNSPLAIVAAHLDGDAYPDLAITGQASPSLGRVSILFNNGPPGGGFAAPVHYNAIFSSGASESDVAASDVDLDGDIDLVYGDGGMHSGNGFEFPFAVAVFRNQGNGTFAAPQPLPLGDFTGGMFELAVADLTQDGWPDVFGSHHSNGGWSVIHSTGNGQFGPYQKHSSGQYPRDVLAADMDNDGDVDPVIVNTNSINVNVHFNPGNGDFSAQHYSIASVFSEIDLADVDADGDVDIGVAYFNLLDGGGVQIVKNDGSGVFAPAFTYPNPTIEFFDPHFADLTSDGLPDLIYAHWDTAPPYTFRWRINQGNGSLGPESIGPVATCGTSDIQPADLDNDGDIDLVMTEWLACINIPNSARRVFIVENIGTPQSPAFALDEIILVDPGPGGVTIGDFNHDDIPDLAVTSQPINLLVGLGNLNYSIVQLSQAPSIPIVHADFNGDTHLDLAVGIVENTSFSPGLGILLGHGDGTFQPLVQYPGSYSPDLGQIQEIAAFDADADGDTDMLAANYASNDISLWANNGDGTFAPQARYGVGLDSPGDLGFADLNGDAIDDLAVPVGIIPGFLGRVAILAGQASSPIVGDVTGDGSVNVNDLLAVINVWGPCPAPPASCPADLNNDGIVNIEDLLLVISNWS
ncbi:MAG: FG-GAP-like repeat-containing protein [Phycisphaerales bacterium]|nr:FG-GAP-like repeat-containing protein [Phycisphaerales bacterium]MCI0630413.1 FG-GAP-like repeat-containing protein [Phycisphaerales bacterium]MCI0675847.1 FG-GAP-like repeat-containing protein [Phycisphaerales bacterium]